MINGEVVGITTSPDELHVKDFFEVTEEEFVELEKKFGDVRPKEDLTKDQIQALSDRQEFLEDCIAEMALTVYQE